MLRELSAEDEQKVVELLAHMYNAIPWAKMRTSKNPHDIFNHRIRAASRRATLYEAVSKLANYFGLQSVPAPAAELVRELRPVERQALDTLYREHIMMAMLGIMLAKEWRGERKDKEGKRTDGSTTIKQASAMQATLFAEVLEDGQGNGN